MKINIVSKITPGTTDILLPFLKDKIDFDIIKINSGISSTIDFKADAKENLILQHPEKNIKIILLGLGEEKDIAKTHSYFRSCIYQNRKKTGKKIQILVDHLCNENAFNAVNGLLVGLRQNGQFKQKKEVDQIQTEELTFVTTQDSHKDFLLSGQKTAETQLEMMHLVDLPPNIKTPEFIAKTTIDSGIKYGYSVNVLYEKDLKEHGLKAILSVGQGSVNPPVLIITEYKPESATSNTPKLGIVGKGITFDTGGLSIKPSASMGYMKSDMAGAAAVIGAVELAAKLKLNIHIVGIIPSAENSVDAKSYRPGDIIDSYSGKSIEIIDTDAEGRLILADGLSYMIKNFNPEYILDIATLTGSVIQTLGYHAAGLFTQNDDFAQKITDAGEYAGERAWRLPLWEDYMTDMHSDLADIKNLSGKPVAGAITAAKFVEFFTESHEKWAHLDIAGVAFGDSEYNKMRSSTGFGVRLLVELMKLLSKK